MSCSNTNPCGCTDECNEVNPCYENCGCLNPTTFECVTKPGVLSAIGVTNDMTGKQVLQAINDTIEDLVVGSGSSGDDQYVKITSSDTVESYLNDKLAFRPNIKKVILNPNANEVMRLEVVEEELVSTDTDNQLDIGTDGKLRVIITPPTADVDIQEGSGVTITGAGTSADPWVIATNPSISAVRTCFNNTWVPITLVNTGTGVTYVPGTAPQFRYRHDGTIEFKGSATYNVDFGVYSGATRKRTLALGNIPTNCLSAGEQGSATDLKAITYIDAPGTGDQITQQYGYIIRKSAQNITIEFQSAYIAATTKTIVVQFDGAMSHPTI